MQSKYCAHYSRIEIEDLAIPRDSVLISIRDPGSERPAARHAEWASVLELQFHDITSETPRDDAWWNSWLKQGYLPPQADHAGEIARFVRQHRDRTIIVHCEMGLSRSAAVCDVLVALGWEYVTTRSEGRRLANRRLVQLLQRQLSA
jgi:predicted protein tyrosine phosphatase